MRAVGHLDLDENGLVGLLSRPPAATKCAKNSRTETASIVGCAAETAIVLAPATTRSAPSRSPIATL
jgi:hypothetical protein